ncbi:5-methylthioadenosine s-adenosylhomocysteine deaminase [Fusarium subglutinans]|uniref:5-methylthioadenosine s-adenosylhomocysteine deaminase n=1 Tax=Gibberella subglutinans TaxID=42677 RepID=A0A8H5PHR9_GIBSU|nr:5-methylthioadenosine s-adenosylhomocysteine deaminase [Fusarium subglutinans]KAF5596759.1 5-methylthioadenosine s-adenosylhomocysteine deaminase [Fusarium subglutinans]
MSQSLLSQLWKQLQPSRHNKRHSTQTTQSTIILLQNGLVLQHDEHDSIQVVENTDILIVDGVIKKIGTSVNPPPHAEVVDCTNKIISPGFINTHHHLWQTQLKGYGTDNCWLDYFSDAESAISAFSDSGIRGVFAYGETFLNLQKWDSESCVPNAMSISEPFIKHVENLAQRGPFGNGCVYVGVSFDGYHMPQQEVEKLFRRALKAGRDPDKVGPSVPKALEKFSLFPGPEDDYTIVISHGNYMDDEDFNILKKHRVPLACTPATEAQGSMGWHLLFEPGLITALGADCHCLTSSSLMQAARTALLFSRLQKTLEYKEKGEKIDKFDQTSHDVFNKATIEAARAVGMENEIGSIAVGKRADILIFSKDQSLAFGASAREEPVSAIVTYSEARDIEAVLVNGRFKKWDGKMLLVAKDGKDIGLGQVLKELDQSQRDIRQKRESCNTSIPKGHFRMLTSDPLEEGDYNSNVRTKAQCGEIWDNSFNKANVMLASLLLSICHVKGVLILSYLHHSGICANERQDQVVWNDLKTPLLTSLPITNTSRLAVIATPTAASMLRSIATSIANGATATKMNTLSAPDASLGTGLSI